MKELLKVAITGPESTGKSLLTETLANHYKTVFTKEYAREYLEKTKGKYALDDLKIMATEQIKRQNFDIKRANRLYFADTEMIVFKVWHEVKYDYVPNWLKEKLTQQEFDLYLLCDIDIPWVFDPLREHPEQREFLMEKYKATFREYKLSYELISGKNIRRIKDAINCIDNLIY
jgi:NadR type nicotinamide-nucleotide adenylyltransferase